MCVAPPCSDTLKNGSETDVDCGGSYGPCADGLDCLVNADCQSGLCAGLLCKKPTLSITAAAWANEGDPITFKVTLSAAINADVTFDYVTHDGTAKAGTDYTSLSATGTIAVGKTAMDVVVTTLAHSGYLGNLKFLVTISNPANATLGNATGIGTIVETTLSPAASNYVTGPNISGGDDQVCAVVNGGAQCWGANDYGQIGDNTTSNPRLVPKPVYGLSSGVQTVVTGGHFSCALVNGGVQCWGAGTFGQLGNNAANESHVPVQVSGLTG